MRTCCWKDDFGVDYSIKDAGFELLIEVGVKGLDDVYNLKKLQFNRSRFALRIIRETNPNLASDKIQKNYLVSQSSLTSQL